MSWNKLLVAFAATMATMAIVNFAIMKLLVNTAHVQEAAVHVQETTILDFDASLFTGYESRGGQTQDGCQVTLYGTRRYQSIDVFVAEGDEIVSGHRPNAFVLICLESNPRIRRRYIRVRAMFAQHNLMFLVKHGPARFSS